MLILALVSFCKCSKMDRSDSSTLFVPSEGGDGRGGGFCSKSPGCYIINIKSYQKGEEDEEEPVLPNESSMGLSSDSILFSHSAHQPSWRESV